MARFSCRHCREEGEYAYRPGAATCPRCGSPDVRIAASIMEMPDDDPLWVDLKAGSDAWEKSVAAQRKKRQKS
jgi:hypothetical protein